ncbi:unnamed protein product, partial [marine sediment metagenome]
IVKISEKPFNVYKYHTGVEVPIVLNRQGNSDWSKLTSMLCQDQQRNDQIVRLVSRNSTSKILILTWRHENHVIPLVQMLKDNGENVDYMAGTKKKYSDSRILIGTISKIGTGFDEKAACDDFNGIRINLLILVGSIKNVELLEQVAGRCFRADFPSIIHFVDDMKIIQNHWKEAKKWYESRNGTINEFESEEYKRKHRPQVTTQSAPGLTKEGLGTWIRVSKEDIKSLGPVKVVFCMGWH